MKELLSNWLIVYIGNFIGSILLSLLLYACGVIENNIELMNTFISIANKKVNYSFFALIILGFLCNILVCTAVFLATNAKSTLEKIAVIIIPIFLFIVLGFEHSVANMYYLSMAYIFGSFEISELLITNLLPVTFGNILGGILLSLYLYFTKRK